MAAANISTKVTYLLCISKANGPEFGHMPVDSANAVGVIPPPLLPPTVHDSGTIVPTLIKQIIHHGEIFILTFFS